MKTNNTEADTET